MSATIPLLRSPGDGKHLDRLKPFVRSRYGTYHHRPRAASVHDDWWTPSTIDRLTVHAWCGQMMNDPLPMDEPDGPICGTCEGRFLGWQDRERIIFSPIDLWGRPVRCPLVNFDTKRCPVCGEKQSWRYSSWHGGSPQAHRAGDGIEAWTPCPQHGWKWMRQEGRTVLCFWHAGPDGYCGFELEQSA